MTEPNWNEIGPELLAVLEEILAAEEGPGETDRPHMIRGREVVRKAKGEGEP